MTSPEAEGAGGGGSTWGWLHTGLAGGHAWCHRWGLHGRRAAALEMGFPPAAINGGDIKRSRCCIWRPVGRAWWHAVWSMTHGGAGGDGGCTRGAARMARLDALRRTAAHIVNMRGNAGACVAGVMVMLRVAISQAARWTCVVASGCMVWAAALNEMRLFWWEIMTRTWLHTKGQCLVMWGHPDGDGTRMHARGCLHGTDTDGDGMAAY
jgi:hypothetical protein